MSTNGTPRTPQIAIIGAGMSGLCMAAKLKLAGIESFTIYEKADSLGGTWRDNNYPGLTCDVPSRFYQFRFAPNPDWSQWFSAGDEIWRYFDKVADDLDIRRHVELGREVTAAHFQNGRWELDFADGRSASADFLVSACGILRIPRYPEIDGLDSFTGAVFHSARWDHDVPLDGKRIAVVGTGSTGAQIVSGLAGVAGEVKLFQRSAQWILPMFNPRVSSLTRWLHRRFPALDRVAYDSLRAGAHRVAPALTAPGPKRSAIQAICRLHLRTVRDPALRAALTPDYQPMCKRLVASSAFYKAIQRDDVALVTDGIERIEPAGIVTTDGTLHEVDVIALATGFDAHAFMRPMQLTGNDGLTLTEAWKDGPRAYLTVALPGFPNFFTLMGPHSPVGNYSLTEIAETQADHVLAWIERWRAGQLDTVAPTEDATTRFNADMRAAMPGTVWSTGCSSWYLGADGVPELWPWTPDRHRAMLSQPRLEDYEIHSTERVATPAA
ncbi:NAD(P)/FAD-dependent oxidoreductase [Paraconexibacter antarcticus]|uniref:NAD(P)/FAD-dependent oxidoreductase n=1 Tax=Paraconexibacter antarcticus TaxID=2949664 RepID=A0ABY5DW65_9ACTN|nr:NAD(P)/FAD-dependent oxidoreductase [Paraconexibacter antarcticus]UTI66248.1 NAD(P)/FAD-dependent oxidoreductase [Paraconexibacter antarcticus]